MDEEIITICAQESGERIDALLARLIEGMSRNAAQKLLDEGKVSLGGQAVKKNYKCRCGDIFQVELPEPECTELVAQNIPLDIVYEDSDLIVVNKERGMVVHPAAGHPDGTLVNALLWHCGDSLSGIGGEKRPGIVHRIDKDTSGLLAVAKNDFTHQGLSAQLSDHSLCRQYEAIVHGNFREDSGTISAAIGRHPVDRKRMAIVERNGKHAVTHWQVLARYRGYTHIECRLETGRTHQIRVHMASKGHCLLGDYTYGAPQSEKGLSGQCLHARRLKFIHPRSGALIELEAPLPEYFMDVIGKLGEIIG